MKRALWTSLSALPLAVLSIGAQADPAGDRGAGFWHHGWGWDHMLFGSLMMTVFWGGLVVLAIMLVRGSVRSSDTRRSDNKAERAMQILEERFARGDIEKGEFEERKGSLSIQPK